MTDPLVSQRDVFPLVRSLVAAAGEADPDAANMLANADLAGLSPEVLVAATALLVRFVEAFMRVLADAVGGEANDAQLKLRFFDEMAVTLGVSRSG